MTVTTSRDSTFAMSTARARKWRRAVMIVLLGAVLLMLESKTSLVPYHYFDAAKNDDDIVQKVNLGAQLFHDRTLSASGNLACSDCHRADHGWSDPTIRKGRNAPSLFGVTRRHVWSWDGGKTDLESQLLAPLVDSKEMANADIAAVIEKLNASTHYASSFRAVFGEDADAARLADALRAFVNKIDEPSRFDRFAAGDNDALSDQERAGMHVFKGRAGCITCHSGPLLSDDSFHNLGLSAFGEPSQDLGRYRITGIKEDVGRFRTPSLRHVSRTAPYMHSGHFKTLESVVNFYMRGGGDVWLRNETEANDPLRRAAATLSPHIRPFNLNEAERDALIAFLKAL